eukprot:SAG31_NODE_921_length_10984_cov_2.779329_5_plen_260_part_00
MFLHLACGGWPGHYSGVRSLHCIRRGLFAAKVPAVVVLVHGGGLAIEEIKEAAPAILDAHYPGEVVGATAVAEALYGGFSPAGKLTYSVMPKEFTRLSDFSSMSLTTPPGRTYKYYPTDASMPAALWSFGWGLTYTHVNISVEAKHHTNGNPVIFRNGTIAQFDAAVANTGEMDSDEVCFVFMVPPRRTAVPTPKRQLLDFERIHVAAGAVLHLQFDISATQLELVGLDGDRVLHQGNFTLEFSNGVDATASLEVNVVA